MPTTLVNLLLQKTVVEEMAENAQITVSVFCQDILNTARRKLLIY